MKPFSTIQRHVRQLMSASAMEQGGWRRLAHRHLHLWAFCWRRLKQNNDMAMSAALSYQTVFAMIPMLVLAVLVLKSVGAIEDSKTRLRSLLEASGISQIYVSDSTTQASEPASQPVGATASQPEAPVSGDGEAGQPKHIRQINVADQIEQLAEKYEKQLTVARVGPVGAVLLIWAAIAMLTTVERSLNRIFGASRDRRLVTRVMLYWSALTLAPLVLLAAQYLGGRVMSVYEQHTTKWLLSLTGQVISPAVGIFVLMLLYKFLPNTRVLFRSALIGAVVAGLLWLAAKFGFAIYVQKLVRKENMYGVLGLLPLFLVWLNLSWLIFLFGAELVHAIENAGRVSEDAAAEAALSPTETLAAAAVIARRYLNDEGPVTLRDLTAALRLNESAAQKLVQRLQTSRIILTVSDDEDAYVLSRPAEHIGVKEILELDEDRIRQRLPEEPVEQTDPAVFQAVRRLGGAVGDMTLAQLIATGK